MPFSTIGSKSMEPSICALADGADAHTPFGEGGQGCTVIQGPHTFLSDWKQFSHLRALMMHPEQYTALTMVDKKDKSTALHRCIFKRYNPLDAELQ